MRLARATRVATVARRVHTARTVLASDPKLAEKIEQKRQGALPWRVSSAFALPRLHDHDACACWGLAPLMRAMRVHRRLTLPVIHSLPSPFPPSRSTEIVSSSDPVEREEGVTGRIPDNHEQATGLERLELIELAKGNTVRRRQRNRDRLMR